MCVSAAPKIILGSLRYTGAHRVQLYITRRRQQMALIHRERGKPTLPQMPPPAFAKIDAPCIAPVRLAYGLPEGRLGFGNGDQVDVIGHQAIGPYRHAIMGAPFGHQVLVGPVILITEETVLTPVAPLGHMMRKTRYYDARYSYHIRRLSAGC